METINSPRIRPNRDSVESALDIIGDRWVFLILREAFFGVRRYDQILKNTGASPNILSSRLKKLVSAGIFEKVKYSAHRNRFEYKLTPKGLDLYPMIVLLLKWGDKWQSGDQGPPLKLIHMKCGQPLVTNLVCSSCDDAVIASDVDWVSNE